MTRTYEETKIMRIEISLSADGKIHSNQSKWDNAVYKQVRIVFGFKSRSNSQISNCKGWRIKPNILLRM